MTEPTTFNIKEFDISFIRPTDISNTEDTGSKVVIIGKPDSGKSVLMKEIVYKKKHQYPVVCVANGNEDANDYYKSSFPETCIHTELTDELIEGVRQRQIIAKKHLVNPWLMFLKDDVVDSSSHFKRASIITFYKRARHWNLLSVLGLQYAFEIPPAIRVCIDYTFIFREANLPIRKVLYENFASIIPTFKLFCKIMDEITGDYTALVINNRITSNNPEDCVFWYKANPELGKGLKYCCEDAWLFDKQRLYVEDK